MEGAIEYKDTHAFGQEELERLFLSVEWSSGHYPEKLVVAMHASQVVFNKSDIQVWQVPRNAYRLCLMSDAILAKRLGDSAIGRHLNSKLSQFIGQDKQAEAYVLGDNPLVLLSALRSNWEPDASSSVYEWRDRPAVLDNGRFQFGTNDSKVRVYRSLDTYLLFEDMFAKLNE